jgi:hypothetical protein
MEIATTTLAPKMRATWLAPSKALVPKNFITSPKTIVRTMNGIRDTAQEGLPSLLNIFIFVYTKNRAKLTNYGLNTLFLYDYGKKRGHTEEIISPKKEEKV